MWDYISLNNCKQGKEITLIEHTEEKLPKPQRNSSLSYRVASAKGMTLIFLQITWKPMTTLAFTSLVAGTSFLKAKAVYKENNCPPTSCCEGQQISYISNAGRHIISYETDGYTTARKRFLNSLDF